MPWTLRDTGTQVTSYADKETSESLDEEKRTGLPVIKKEADSGAKGFTPIKFQPVMAVLTFEAEFAPKEDDIIFHIWPWGYHEAERAGRRPPNFPRYFELNMLEVFKLSFGENRIDASFDADMGSWFVKAKGFASNQFYRDICITAVQRLHDILLEKLKKGA